MTRIAVMLLVVLGLGQAAYASPYRTAAKPPAPCARCAPRACPSCGRSLARRETVRRVWSKVKTVGLIGLLGSPTIGTTMAAVHVAPPEHKLVVGTLTAVFVGIFNLSVVLDN